MTAMPQLAAPPDGAPAPQSATDDGPSRRRKAAMVVQLLVSDGARLPLSRLPEDLQVELAREVAALGLVDRRTVQAVAEEFADALESIAITGPDGVSAALAALGPSLSPVAAARLRAEATGSLHGDPWAALLELPPAELVPLMENESTEVAAIVLSKLPVPKAAALLTLLPGEKARRITHAVSRTAAVSPEAVHRIGTALAADYGDRPPQAFPVAPVKRVGAILNQSTATTREAMLAALDSEDPDFAEGVRRAIFTFGDIPARLKPLDVPRVLRAVAPAELTTALAAAAAGPPAVAATAEFLLSNLPGRMASQLREEMAARGRVRQAEGEAAMNALVTAIRDRVDTGEIVLISPEDEDDSA
jgi:flagellar motor switch protein FliG